MAANPAMAWLRRTQSGTDGLINGAQVSSRNGSNFGFCVSAAHGRSFADAAFDQNEKRKKKLNKKNTKIESLYLETFLNKHGPNKQASGEWDEVNDQVFDFPSCSEIRNPVFCTSQSGC